MAEIKSEPMEWGSLNHILDASGWTGVTVMGMPNIHEKRQQGHPHHDDEVNKWVADTDKIYELQWIVPIDDEYSVEFKFFPPGRFNSVDNGLQSCRKHGGGEQAGG